MREIGIGLLGLGTVGGGVVETLLRNGELLAQRTGVRLVLRRVAELDAAKRESAQVGTALLTSSAEDVVRATDVDVVVELIGGTGAARELTAMALALKKPVVTANKALLACHGAELFKMAAENGTAIYFEASVGGGIPLLRSLHEGLAADRVRRMYGILNGTCNFILTSMEKTGCSFDEALRAAQQAGYAEADPALDIDGMDTAHKAVILASLASGRPVPLASVAVEGIRHLTATDVEYARDLGYSIRLLAVIIDGGDAMEVRVHPALVHRGHILASVDGVFNALLIDSDGAGEVLFYGRGAGRAPTASAVVNNLADAARALLDGSSRRSPLPAGAEPCPVRDSGDSESRYYLRLTLLDRPGVFGEIGRVLGRHGISIASLLQKEDCAGSQVPVIIITHGAPERALKQAMAEIDAMQVVGAPTVRFRIVDEA